MLGSIAIKTLPLLLIPTSNIGGSNVLFTSYFRTELHKNGFTNVDVMEWSVLRHLRLLDLENYMEVLFSPNPDSSELALINKVKSSAAVIFFSPYFNGALTGNAKLMLDWTGLRQPDGGTLFNDKIVDIVTITGQSAEANLGGNCGCPKGKRCCNCCGCKGCDCNGCDCNGCDCKGCDCNGCDCKESVRDSFHKIVLKTCVDMKGRYLKASSNRSVEIFGNFNREDPNGPGPYTMVMNGKNQGSKEAIELYIRVNNFIYDLNATMHKHISPSKDGSWKVSYGVGEVN
jgi:hypothetical protein